MTKKKTEFEKMLVRKKIIAAFIIGFLVVGYSLMMFIFGVSSIVTNMGLDEHMTDPTIPYNERDNSTYTFTGDWIVDRVYDMIYIGVFAASLLAVGYAMIITSDALMSRRQVHKLFCDYSGKTKYCPNCGIEMSLLKKKNCRIYHQRKGETK